MISYLFGIKRIMNQEVKRKVNQINSIASREKIYAETNHTFIKGFGWIIPSYLPEKEIGIIMLKRDRKTIISSLKRIQCTPLTIFGLKWLLNPWMMNQSNVLPFINRILYPFYLLINSFLISKLNKNTFNVRIPSHVKTYEEMLLNWYVDETYSMKEKYQKVYPKIKIFETCLEQLNYTQEFINMFDFFGIEYMPKKTIFEKIGKKTNLKLFK